MFFDPKFFRLSEELDILRIFFSDCVEEDINKDSLERVIFKILLDFEQERTGLSSIIRYLVRNVKNKQSSALLMYLSIIFQITTCQSQFNFQKSTWNRNWKERAGQEKIRLFWKLGFVSEFLHSLLQHFLFMKAAFNILKIFYSSPWIIRQKPWKSSLETVQRIKY